MNGKFEIIELLDPFFKSDLSVIEALKKRRTVREISDRDLSIQDISNILWAANGVNREKADIGIKGRTAASASNSQEIDLYVFLREGVYLYDAFNKRLMPILQQDLRPLAIGRGQSELGHKAPMRIVYIADIDKLVHTTGFQEPGLKDPEVQKSYFFVDTGMAAGNIYLLAASMGFASWFHNCDKEGIGERIKLSSGQRVLFGQTVGYPIN